MNVHTAVLITNTTPIEEAPGGVLYTGACGAEGCDWSGSFETEDERYQAFLAHAKTQHMSADA